MKRKENLVKNKIGQRKLLFIFFYFYEWVPPSRIEIFVFLFEILKYNNKKLNFYVIRLDIRLRSFFFFIALILLWYPFIVVRNVRFSYYNNKFFFKSQKIRYCQVWEKNGNWNFGINKDISIIGVYSIDFIDLYKNLLFLLLDYDLTRDLRTNEFHALSSSYIGMVGRLPAINQ